MDEPELNDTLRRAVEELRRPVSLGQNFAPRVLSAARRRRSPLAGAMDWLLRPRLSPLGGFVLVGAAAAVLLLLLRANTPAIPTHPVTRIQFVLRAPAARSVTIVGDFNNWDPSATPLATAAGSGGIWSVVVPLHTGRHEYAFVVDGRAWVSDPIAPRSTDQDFGAPNSVVTIS
ncbi:MAG TPA: isoamylase early set domain-containing protein [Gemmatimonadales bacterium]|nr:isoamylase early set domain-containing protein [Gemmatimonadales bacterium]